MVPCGPDKFRDAPSKSWRPAGDLPRNPHCLSERIDRAAALAVWLADHRERLPADAEAEIVELEIAWQQFKARAAAAAGEIRTAGRAERRGDV